MNNNKLMLFITGSKWVEYCFSIFYFNVTKWYSEKQATVMEFKPLSRYWEQTLTIFDDILLERTVHVQLGLKKQCTVKKVSKYVVRIGCE